MIDRSGIPLPEKGERAERIGKIIADVMSRRAAGEEVEESEFERRHPDLLPELHEQFRRLRAIETAAECARTQDPQRALEIDNDGDQGSIDYIQSQLEGYRILERLSRGGQGVVYKAVQKTTNRTVAIKVLLDGALASARKRHRFAREVEFISRLNHPNIVTLFDSGVTGSPHYFAYFAMEHVEGVPIDGYMLVERPPVADLVRMFRDVCGAVSYAHQRGIIHRDLKPSNILVDGDGQPRILDFGLAKELSTEELRSDVSAVSIPGQIVGTLQYLSPEQVGGEDEETDVRSDIYSLGVVLYQILTGRFPYRVAGKLEEIRKNITSVEPMSARKALRSESNRHFVDPDAIPVDLEAIVLMALRKEKDRRYQSAAAMADDLDCYLKGEAVRAKADSSLYVFRKNIRKYRVHVGIASAFFLLVVVAAIVAGLGWREARAQRDYARQATGIAQSTLANVVGIINKKLEPLAGGLAVREELHDVVSDELEHLQALAEADETLQVNSALRQNLGDIAYDRGRHAEAHRHYLAALDVAQRSVRASPDSLDAGLELVRVRRKLGRVAERPDEEFGLSIEMAEALTRRFPAEARAAIELCATEREYSENLVNAGRYREALRHSEAGLSVAEAFVSDEGYSDRWGKFAASLHVFRGRAALKLGNGPLLYESLIRAIAIRREIAQRNPADMETRHRLLVSYSLLGGYHRDLGDSKSAEASLLHAVQVGELLHLVAPSNLRWTKDYYGACDRLSRLYRELGEQAEGDEARSAGYFFKARRQCEIARRLAIRLV
ncbi:MAG: serine/threonine-protein kinase, partial [Planctomycetota bacterium]|nr:serine/threonine-protein kinase [Planctomycetota bacterium]